MCEWHGISSWSGASRKGPETQQATGMLHSAQVSVGGCKPKRGPVNAAWRLADAYHGSGLCVHGGVTCDAQVVPAGDAAGGCKTSV